MRKAYVSLRKVITVLSLVLLFYTGNAAAEQLSSPPLFSDAGIAGTWAEATVSDQGEMIRSRLVKVHFDRLCQLETAYSCPLHLNLFEDVNFTVQFYRVEPTFSGGTAYTGFIEEHPGAEIIMVKNGEILSANIYAGGGFYQVRFEPGGLHRVMETDQSQYPQELPPVPVTVPPGENRGDGPLDTGKYIDVMVVYTAAARSGAGGTTAMENLIDLAVSETNTGYNNSGVTQRLRLVHTAEVDYSESGFSWSTTLSRLQKPSDGYMDDVHTWRDTYGADEVALIVNNTSSCGIGYMMQFATTAFAPYAFVVVSRVCATGYYSFAHELGHNMGSAHDRDNASVVGTYDYSYGYQAPDEAFRTIMAYNCPGGCTRLNYWSNPDKQYGGQDMGVVYTDPLAADNRRSLNNTLSTVRNFRQKVSAPSITVTSPNGGETLTGGTSHTVTWTTTGVVGNVKIEYYSEDHLDGVTIASSTANDGSYSWTVPETAQSNCLVEISEAADGSPSDFSDAFFTIEESAPASPTITVTSPNGGEILTVGTNHTITWATTGTVGNVKIKYYNENYPGGVTIVSSTVNDGIYSWTVPDDPSSSCLVEVSEADDGSPSDFSNAIFTIIESSPTTPTITVTSPNGGEELEVGTSYTITWTTTGTVGRVKIRYTTNNGSNWSAVTSSTSNDGSHTWIVPDKVSSNCLVKISEASDGSPSDTSNRKFSIVSTPASFITVTSPNGGEELEAGTSFTVTWTTTGTVASVKIQYSIDNGNSWNTVTSSTGNDGTYSWKVPDVDASQCFVKITEASDGSPSDTSDTAFSIFTPQLIVTSPNGDEELEAGTSFTVTWTTTGTGGNVKIQYSLNDGSSWSNITSSTANDGSYSWTVADVDASQCLVRVFEASDGNPSDTSDDVFSIYVPVPPEISLNRTVLNYGAIQGGSATSGQLLLIENTGGGTLNWAIGSDVSWLSSTPASGTGAGAPMVTVNASGLAIGTYTGTINVTAADASNSPQTVTVTLTVKTAAGDEAPFGDFATPQDGSTGSSSIPMSGWVLDDVEVVSVKIYNGSDYIGDAVFVEGARSDIEQSFPGYPKNYQAGWGYMLLSNFLPNGGNGTYTLHARASDSSGKVVLLGSKTVHIDNASAVKPFGAIDSPAQGGTVSGSKFTNSGWVLTPQSNKIPEDGSTIEVYVDGVKVGTANYNGYREDIATLFPGYANSDGASAWFQFDTTGYSNGVHSIYWIAADDAGNVDGIGSRFFTVLNTGSGSLARTTANMGQGTQERFHDIPVDFTGPVGVTKGYAKNIALQEIYPDDNGMINIEMKELDRVEVRLNADRSSAPSDRWFGSRLIGEELRPLPVGSTFDAEKGIFNWSLGPGFVGIYELIFIDKNGSNSKRIKINILPKCP
jgi:hypothetical protein